MLSLMVYAAAACDFAYPSASSMVDAADDVFVGDVISGEADPGDDAFTIWTLEVVERWKGASETPITVRGENISDCSAALDAGDRVLVFYDASEGLSLMDVLSVRADPAPESFLREAACELGRGDSTTDWHLRDEVRCNGCSAVPGSAGSPLVVVGLGLGTLLRRQAIGRR